LKTNIGYFTGEDISVDGTLAVKNRPVFTKETASKSQNHKQEQEFINTGSTNIYEMVSEEIKEKAKDRINDVFLNYSGVKKEAEDLKEIVKIIMGDVYDDPLVVFNIDTMLMYGEKALFSHCLDVAILSTILAVKAGLPRPIVKDVAIGASLHDIGKLYLDKQLNNPAYVYTKEDYLKVLNHTLYGFNILKDTEFSNNVKKIVLMHHVWERFEDSYNDKFDVYESYPLNTEHGIINPKLKDITVSIVQTCDVFETMTSRTRKYQSSLNYRKALKYIRNMEKSKFGSGVRLLANYISPFSLGSKILTSDGEKALVIEHNSHPDRPVLKYLTGEKSGMVINLVLPEWQGLYIEEGVI
jgi:putative nucleotidyltransferase with HDIG domain